MKVKLDSTIRHTNIFCRKHGRQSCCRNDVNQVSHVEQQATLKLLTMTHFNYRRIIEVVSSASFAIPSLGQLAIFCLAMFGLAAQSDAQNPTIKVTPLQPAGNAINVQVIQNATPKPTASTDLTASASKSPTVVAPSDANAKSGAAQSKAAGPKPDADTQIILDTIKTLPDNEKRAMFAYYKDLGVNLSLWLQPDGTPVGPASTRRRQLVRLMRTVNFVRRPEAVLKARSQIGLDPEALPSDEATDKEIVDWFHRHAMAAEWDAVKALLVMRAGKEAEGMYASLIQGTNHVESELIPEDVLGLSEAAPAELTDWQVESLAKLLKSAAKKASTRPLVERFRKGTSWFGTKDAKQRDQTARLLLAAGLPIEAYEFMPSLEKAREMNNAQVMKGHAEYHLARAAELKDAEADQLVETAWSLLGEVALLDEADAELRSQCLGQAVDLLPRVPPGPGAAWLRSLFEHPSLAPAGLQAVALKALNLQDEKLPETVRAQAILTMKEAVDTLLAQETVQFDQLTIPLRMLTIGLVARAEGAIKKEAAKNTVSAVAALLLRSMPNEAWRQQIEPSLVGRAYKAFIGVALIADETDLALNLLAQGIDRQPVLSSELASDFLNLWVSRMKAKASSPPMSQSSFFYAYSRTARPSTPITRGWQTRNLSRLAELLDLLDEIGVDGRSLPGVVKALSACYGPTQAYDRKTIEKVLGPVAEIKSSVAAQLATTMQQGLSGDWRSRKAQEDAGFERSDSELRKIVEEGYDLATALAEAAVTNCEDEQDAWQHSILKAALRFDRMQFRGERDQDAVAYHAARKMVFTALKESAEQYRRAVADGRVRPNLQIYNVWFNLTLGASDLGALTLENLMTEGMENADQIDVMRQDILKMTPERSAYHFGEFARGIMASLSQSKPEVKPRLMQAAARLVGDDPAGAPIRRTLDLYNELVQDEIQLHLTIDGSDRVGTEPFGAMLSLQHTASIDRSSGGFSRYLMPSFSQFSGGQWQTINYQERLQKSIETSFDGQVKLLGIGFFQPMNPAVPIRQAGKVGWQEKPMAYLVLQALDPSVDRLPAVQMDMHFNDASGPIVLPVLSNTVLVDAGAEPAPRPIGDLVIEQKLDARPMLESQDDETVTLEVTATATGVLPEINRLLKNLGDALPGYELDDAQLGSDPYEVSQAHRAQPEDASKSTQQSPFLIRGPSLPNLDPDSDGFFRLGTMRNWTVTYRPESTLASTKPPQFAFPALDEASISTLVSTNKGEDGGFAKAALPTIKRYSYEDYDLLPVEADVLSFQPKGIPVYSWVLGGAAVLLLVFFCWWILRSKQGIATEGAAASIPETLTPTGAALLLRRIEDSQASLWTATERSDLRSDIETIQRQYFAGAASSTQGSDGQIDANLRPTVQRWAQRAVN